MSGCKTVDSHYHVDGELVIASRDTQYSILKLCMPLWEAANGRHMVVVAPMPRYVKAGCCPEPDHITNRVEPEYYPKMKTELAACSSAIKDFLFTSGLRNGRLMDPVVWPHRKSGGPTRFTLKRRCTACLRMGWWRWKSPAAVGGPSFVPPSQTTTTTVGRGGHTGRGANWLRGSTGSRGPSRGGYNSGGYYGGGGGARGQDGGGGGHWRDRNPRGHRRGGGTLERPLLVADITATDE